MPALFFLLALTVLRLKGLIAASLTVLISVAVSSLVFGIPKASIVGAALLGIATASSRSALSC
ncbi:L-lactate permease [Xanthomonas arboricola]|uniref:L-lactate permease n=1 Tax=Xanthomonas arboricola TaxID=56448 RepID=UPI00039A124C|nr:L-lactate permease [Xanthomonas arboricola]AKU51883.1 hypothetical protein AKJ12_20435 [Xanthomonas arboricola pv. juglandis]KOB01335.1 hypothetical protein AE920_06195 [Xanthomonas arboricola]KOB02869.1 hypothetical protein AE921_04765 [Xanthomonas arboricola]KOB07508.1 hypothetical protein AE923_13000 [Xanthomonas arboricola]KOB09791.1 hypothetical protein AE922_06040 [Xanthomonas arboricola]